MSKFNVRFNSKEANASKVSVNDEVMIMIEGEGIVVEDEYHTIHELYHHRMALTIALTRVIMSHYDGTQSLVAYRSKNHHPESNPMFEGYFIVWIQDRDKVIASYHYDLKHWNDFNHLEELEYSPEWDGHTPDDVIKRLKEI